jgi:hypothetical protein
MWGSVVLKRRLYCGGLISRELFMGKSWTLLPEVQAEECNTVHCTVGSVPTTVKPAAHITLPDNSSGSKRKQRAYLTYDMPCRCVIW